MSTLCRLKDKMLKCALVLKKSVSLQREMTEEM